MTTMGAIEPLAGDRMSRREFERLASFIESTCGIRMPPSKKIMVEGRLRRRLRVLGMASLDEYCQAVFDLGRFEGEVVHLIDAVTTNKTEFFREPEHFDLLVERVIPALLERRHGGERHLKLWSAACSTGPEPYTLAMVLNEQARMARGLRYSILGTDISTEVLAKAKLGIYPAEMLAHVPAELQRRYFMRSRRSNPATIRLTPEIRQAVRFGRLNLMEAEYLIDIDMDVIFCRNILIYFDKATQQAVIGRLCEHLRPGGYLFLGHSETVAGMNLPLEPAAAAVFRRR